MRSDPRLRVFGFLVPAAGVLLAGLIAPLSAVTVSGTVVSRQDGRLEPVFRAEVIARGGGSAEVVAVARTDREGRFFITGLETPRVTLSVRKSRYFTASANGREGENVTLDCSVPADCGDVRFELGIGAVVTGMVRDELGEPAMMAMVSASSPEGGERESQMAPMSRAGFTTTDERGYFRIFGLKPGRYALKTERPARGPSGSRGFEGEPVEIEVEEGGEVHGVLVVGRRSESSQQFSLSGKVTGVEMRDSDMGVVTVHTLKPRSRWGNFSTGTSVGPDGAFTLPALAAGRYALSFVRRGNRREFGFGEDAIALGILDLQSDRTGVVLKPVPPTGFIGVLKFESGDAPPDVQVRASSEETWVPFSAAAKPPDYRFELTNLNPGTYSLGIDMGDRSFMRGRDPGEFFLRGMRRGSEIVPARDITLSEGRVEEVELVISNEFSRVYGRVKAASEAESGSAIRKGAQFQVGLSGPRGFRALQADQNGRFDFDKVVPGDYRICAWSDPDALAIYDEKTWTAAGDAVRKFSVDTASEVEIDLTAVP